MQITIPDTIQNIYQKFQTAGFQIFLVGGCIRNILLGKQTKDWDFTTNATPQQILMLFPEGFYDNEFGTVGVPITLSSPLPLGEGKGEGYSTVVEITTFRTEREYKDFRHPTN